MDRQRERSPGEVEVNNAFAIAGSLAQDLVPDSADQVAILYSYLILSCLCSVTCLVVIAYSHMRH